MVEFRELVAIAAPVDDVVAVLHDVAGWPSWNPSVSTVERPGRGPLSVGEAVTVKQPRLAAAQWTVVAVNASGFAWASSVPGVHSTGEHWAQDTGDGRTTVALTLAMTGRLARLTAAVYGRLIRRYVRAEADGLRCAAEGRAVGQ